MSDDTDNAMRRLEEAGDTIAPAIRAEIEAAVVRKVKTELRRGRRAKARFRAGLDELAGVKEPDVDVAHQELVVELAAAVRESGVDPADVEAITRLVVGRLGRRSTAELVSDVMDELEHGSATWH